MAFICERCVKNESLRAYIAAHGTVTMDCPICGSHALVMACDDPVFSGKVRAVIRYHLSETSYNTHLGGEHLCTVLCAENEITNYLPQWNAEAYEEALLELTDPVYMDYDKGISLHAGYYDGHQLPHLRALRTSFDDRLHELKWRAERKNYFLLEKECEALLSPLVDRIARELAIGTTLYRCRIGSAASGFPLFGWQEERHYRAFPGNQLGAPPPLIAGVGRMNRVGVSFLYVATSADTAIAEVRPNPGHFCTVGAFTSKRILRFADFSTEPDVCEYSASDLQLEEFLLLKSIGDTFSMPIVPEERRDYHFSQLLADTLRHLKFDGVSYGSSVGSGKNYVFFDPDAFDHKAGSGQVVSVDKVTYSTSNTVAMGADNDYLTRADGTFV